MDDKNFAESPGWKVLLVEDDPLLAIVMAKELDSVGIKHWHTNNGSKAIELLKTHVPALMILDINLPGLNGFEVVEKIINDPEMISVHKLPLIIHTSHDLTEEEKAELTLGQTIFLTKTKVEDLAETVQSFMAQCKA